MSPLLWKKVSPQRQSLGPVPAPHLCPGEPLSPFLELPGGWGGGGARELCWEDSSWLSHRRSPNPSQARSDRHQRQGTIHSLLSFRLGKPASAGQWKDPRATWDYGVEDFFLFLLFFFFFLFWEIETGCRRKPPVPPVLTQDTKNKGSMTVLGGSVLNIYMHSTCGVLP